LEEWDSDSGIATGRGDLHGSNNLVNVGLDRARTAAVLCAAKARIVDVSKFTAALGRKTRRSKKRETSSSKRLI
jgi:hypothetical protein